MQEKSNKHTITINHIYYEKLPYLNYGIFFSVIVHIILLYCLIKKPDITKHNLHNSRDIFFVEFYPKSKNKNKIIKSKDKVDNEIQLKNQIVDNSDIINNKVPIRTNLKSDKNNTVTKEQIKRGDSLNVNNIKNSNLKTKYNVKNDINNKISNNVQKSKPLSLKLDNETLFKNFGNIKNNNQENSSLSVSKNLSYKPFSRPQGSGARFLGSYGSSMYLPNLPDGDMTMLNTKAEYFAVFVRRVATRVFSELRLSGWENLSKEDIYQINSFSEIEATMSLSGNILSVKLLSSSGSFSFDDILKQAVKTAGKDSNPPQNAKADDGLIHFIFQAKSWSKLGTNPNGSLGERRWLLLSTGLK